DAGDIGAMMAALSDEDAYRANHGNMPLPDFVALGDFDSNNLVDNLDLQGLITALANAPGPGAPGLTAVPEPSSALLLLVGGFAACFAKCRQDLTRQCTLIVAD